MAVESFEDLVHKRTGWYNSSRDNGFTEGIERLLTQLYPDKAHFIFELLQNAEDAQATRVEFRLEANSLVFVHNGKRLFDLRDIESITSIANSTKREDGTSIGKFGIGFKAVFAYTQTPEVHSGEWHFRISHMFVPERCDVKNEYIKKGWTLFKFPFDEPHKSVERAHAEVLDGLKTLAPETILFMRNIKEVYVSYDENEQHITKTVNGPMVELCKLTNDGVKLSSRYLLFSKVIEGMELEDGKVSDSLTVGIGYRLKESDKKGEECRLSERYEIVPVKQRNVYVFFPTEKEVSGLRFCIHAPFATTAARDSIRDNRDNQKLMSYVSELQIESLEVLRDEGFLTTDFLRILPNSDDNIGDMYKCFYDNLIAAFKAKSLVPKKDGGHAPATQLYRGSAKLSDIFSSEDLSLLTNKDDVSWVKNAKMQHSPADKFLSDLEIKEWGVANFVWFLSEFDDECFDGDNDAKRQYVERMIKTVFEPKHNDQLFRFYAILEDYISDFPFNWAKDTDEKRKELVNKLKEAPIFKTLEGSFAKASDGLVTGDVTGGSFSGIAVKYINPETLGGNNSSNQKTKVDNLLKRLGIQPFSKKAEMKIFIERFWKNDSLAVNRKLTNEQAVELLSILIDLVVDAKIDSEIVRDFPVLNKNEKCVKLGQTFLDLPYKDTGLLCYADHFATVGVTQLNDIYANKLGHDNLKQLVNNLTKFPIYTKLWLEKSPLWKNEMYSVITSGGHENKYKEESDWDIPGLESFVKSPTINSGRLVWNFIVSLSESEVNATYKANMSAPVKHCSAKFIQTLSKVRWIPNGDSTGLLKPDETSLEALPSGWVRPREGYGNCALKAMKFGSKTDTQRKEDELESRFFSKKGISRYEFEKVEKLIRLAKEKNISMDDLVASIKGDQKEKTQTNSIPREMPKHSALNVEMRKRKVADVVRRAPRQKFVEVGHTIHIGNAQIKEEARVYLRSEYKYENEKGSKEMICQLCHHNMPFKARSGDGYFEATQIFLRMKKDVAEQFIALCPTCRAKYNEWVRLSPDSSMALRKAIIDYQPMQGEESVEIPISGGQGNSVRSPLFGKSLYFTGAHFIDLQQAVIEDGKCRS